MTAIEWAVLLIFGVPIALLSTLFCVYASMLSRAEEEWEAQKRSRRDEHERDQAKQLKKSVAQGW